MRTRTGVTVLAGLALAAWFGGVILDHGGNPSTLLAAGRDDIRVVSYIAEHLGPDFVPQQAWGHDGKFVFIQAHDPFLLDPSVHADRLDAPVYRSQRVLVPVLAGLGAALGPWGVVWAMPVLMVVAAVVGVWAAAGLVQGAGRSAWWGVAFVANPGLFYAYRRGTVDVAAVALLMLGIFLVSGGRHRAAALALTGAVLAKEVMILGAIGLAVGGRSEGRRVVPVALIPLMAAVGWGGYVRWRLAVPIWTAGVDALTWPFTGWWRVVGRGIGPDAIIAVFVLGAGLAVLVLARLRPGPVTAAGVGFALLLPVLPETVWGGYVDAWRSAAPILAILFVVIPTLLPHRVALPAWPARAKTATDTRSQPV